MKIQFISNPARELIDLSSDRYILEKRDIITEANKLIFGGKCDILPNFFSVYGYDSFNYIEEFSDRLIKTWSKFIRARCFIDITDEEMEKVFSVWFEPVLRILLSCWKKVELIPSGSFMQVYAGTHRQFSTVGEFINCCSFSNEFWDYIYCRIFSAQGVDVRYIKKKNCWKERLWPVQIRIGRVFREPKVLLRVLRRSIIRRGQKNNSCIENTVTEIPQSEILVIQSRMPIDVEREIQRASKDRIVFYESDIVNGDLKLVDESIDLDGRAQLKKLFSSANDFENFAVDFLVDEMPKSMFEGLNKSFVFSDSRFKEKRYRKVYVSGCISETAMCCYNRMRRNGAEIIDIQHSIAYAGSPIDIDKEAKLFDRFITWGDYESNNIKVKNVTMNRVPKKIDEDGVKEKNRVLLICHGGELLSGTYDFSEYNYRVKRFIDGLDLSIRKKLVIRVRNGLGDREIITYCRKKYPYVNFETQNENPINKSILESKLIILDYYGSPHIEAILLGKPFFMFEACPIRKNSFLKEYLKRFQEEGIYSEQGEGLAKIINNLFRLSDWPNRKLECLYNEYLNKVAGEENYSNIWLNEMLE